MLVTEPPAGTAEARLHLIDDEEQVVFAADLLHAFEEIGRRWHIAAFAHYRFDQHGARLLGRGLCSQ